MRKGMLRGNQPKQIVRLRFRNFVKSFGKINRFNFLLIFGFSKVAIMNPITNMKNLNKMNEREIVRQIYVIL